MQNLDIVNLIERNPLVNLSRDYQNKFINKIKQRFNNEQQQLFVASFYCYLNHDSEKDFVIDIDDIWKWIGFSRKDNLKRVLVKNFTKDIDYKIIMVSSKYEYVTIQSDEKDIHKSVEQHMEFNKELRRSEEQAFNNRAHNKEQILLNTDTFKALCMLAGTEKSKEIRKYYLKLENVFQDIIKEESNELRNQLEQKNTIITNVINDSKKHKHNIILQEYNYDCNIVYIIKVKTLENKYVIKIGESRRGITGRYNEHKAKYPECLILDCFLVKRSRDFEKFIHKKLNSYKYNKLSNHENEVELFLVGEELSYNYIQQLVKNNISKYNDDHLEINKYILEIEKLKLDNENLRLSIENSTNTNYNNTEESQVTTTSITDSNLIKELKKIKEELKEEMQNVKEEIRNLYLPNTTNNFAEQLHTVGPYVQQLNPENLSLVKVFEHASDVCRVLKIPRSSLVKAIKQNTIYHNYRWNFVDREKDPYIVENVNPTKQLQKHQNIGYIAKLNNNKSEILNVYLDRKTASILNNYDSVAYLDYFVKHNKPVQSYYYVLYDSLNEALKTKFLNKIKSNNIVLYKNGVGQYNSDGTTLINEFKSVHDCQISVGIGNKSLTKALSTGKTYNGYVYKYLTNKLYY